VNQWRLCDPAKRSGFPPLAENSRAVNPKRFDLETNTNFSQKLKKSVCFVGSHDLEVDPIRSQSLGGVFNVVFLAPPSIFLGTNKPNKPHEKIKQILISIFSD
jgi:hypothetical protein